MTLAKKDQVIACANEGHTKSLEEAHHELGEEASAETSIVLQVIGQTADRKAGP